MGTFWGTAKKETIVAKSSNDTVLGLDGDDTLFGMGGHDILKGGGGADKLFGGTGNDTADYSDSWEHVYIDLRDGTAQRGTAQGDTFDSIENLNGSSYADILFGDANDNVLNGLGGADYMVAFEGVDILKGGEGDDELHGGAGPDQLIGGPDDDIAGYLASPEPVQVSLLHNSAHGGDAENDTFDSIEGLFGSHFDDHLSGDHGSNSIFGGQGGDTLKGYGGADLLVGGPGNDTIMGLNGNDYLYGGVNNIMDDVPGLGGGSDTLVGGLGRDVMAGGIHGDTFVWSSIYETSTTVGDMDVIQDFNFTDGDRIDLDGVDADTSMSNNGNQAFAFIGSTAFSGNPGELRYRYEGGNTIIEMQTGTSPDPEGGIVISGIHTPTASWFVL